MSTAIDFEIELPEGSGFGLVEALLALPLDIRPTHASEDEEGTKVPIGDAASLVPFLDDGVLPFLTGPTAFFDFIGSVGRPMVCRGTADAAPSSVQALLTNVGRLHPLFGFACSTSEHLARNRVAATKSFGAVEAWVGRDWRRYIPGLYWLTLLPDELAQRHGISVLRLTQAAVETTNLYDGASLYRFYEEPNDWKDEGRLGPLLRAPGIFDVARAQSELDAAEALSDVREVLRTWR